jgi:rsbT antagonist protein RsbS
MELRRLPIIKLFNRVLVPIQGEITDDLADQITHEVLKVIHEDGPRGLVLDLTGVWIMDSHLCAALSNLAASARLMGTPTLICGLSPEIAMTLQTMGVELVGVQTALSLEEALSTLGLDVRDTLEDDEDDDDDAEPEEQPRAPEPQQRSSGGLRMQPPQRAAVRTRRRGF